MYCSSFHLIASIIAVCILYSGTGHTKEVVSGKYVSIAKSQIEFIVYVDTPAPTNLIVQHFNPTNAILISTNPQASKIDSENGTAKWFLKSVVPGEISFILSFKKVVSKKGTKAILRYRDPVTENFIETVVLP